MIEPARPDHTKPTLAFIALSIAAAVVLAAGMTDRPRDVVAAADVPTGTPTPVVVERPDVEPRRSRPDRFSIADVVTLAGIAPERDERRDRGRAAPAASPSTDPAPATSGGSRTGSSGGGGSSSSAAASGGSRSSGGDTRDGASGSGGGSGSGSGAATSGPGRSETGRGEARGQRDGTPGKGDRKSQGSSGRSARR